MGRSVERGSRKGERSRMRRSCLGSRKCFPFSLWSRTSRKVKGEEETPAAKTKPGGWKCMPYIIANETFEKVASYGLVANLSVYLVSHFNIEEMAAATAANIFTGTQNFAPLLGAFVSDAYWGRFPTLAYGSFATFLGMVVMTLTAAFPELRPPSCSQTLEHAGQCVGPSNFQKGILLLSMALLVLGAAGVRPCSLPFGVDQFDRATEQGRIGLNSFFNWYYFTSTAATMVAMTLVVYIQDSISWTLGFGIPSALMLLATIVFLLGTKLYVYVAPEGSIFSGIAQVFVASYRKRSLMLPSLDNARPHGSLLYNPPVGHSRIMKLPLTLQFRCLNKAAIVCEDDLDEDGSPVNKWRVCSIQQIEEVKCLIRIVPIWASGIVCFMAIAQQWTFAILQALKMDCQLGPGFKIPPGSLGVVSLLTITFFIPIYDQILVPLTRRITGIESGITLLQRQGVGMVINTFSMVVAGVVEKRRRESALAHGGVNGTSPMSVLWLVPQLAIMGIGEAFNAVGQVEFLNLEFPEHMQSLAASLFNCSLAGASYVSGFLVIILQKYTGGHGQPSWLDNNINVGRVDYFYYVIALMGVVNLLYFMVCARSYRYKGTPEKLNVGEGTEETMALLCGGRIDGCNHSTRETHGDESVRKIGGLC